MQVTYLTIEVTKIKKPLIIKLYRHTKNVQYVKIISNYTLINTCF